MTYQLSLFVIWLFVVFVLPLYIKDNYGTYQPTNKKQNEPFQNSYFRWFSNRLPFSGIPVLSRRSMWHTNKQNNVRLVINWVHFSLYIKTNPFISSNRTTTAWRRHFSVSHSETNLALKISGLSGTIRLGVIFVSQIFTAF